MRGSARARQPAGARGTRDRTPEGAPRGCGTRGRHGGGASLPRVRTHAWFWAPRASPHPRPLFQNPHPHSRSQATAGQGGPLPSLPVTSLSQRQGNNHIQDTTKHEANPQATQQHPHVTTQPSSVRGRRASTQREPSTPAWGPGLCLCSPSRKQPGRPKGLRPRGPQAEQQRP